MGVGKVLPQSQSMVRRESESDGLAFFLYMNCVPPLYEATEALRCACRQ